MNRWILPAVLAAALSASSAAAPNSAVAADPPDDRGPERAMAPDAPFAEYVSPADSLPHLRYFADGQVSLNDRCPVRKVRLNPRMGAAYVNGRPVGFC